MSKTAKMYSRIVLSVHLRRKNLCVDVENNLKHPDRKPKLKILQLKKLIVALVT